MLKNYFKIAFRNLVKNRGYSAINIGGLAIGMAVAILIGLWVHDELSFNEYHQHHDRIALVLENQNISEGVETYSSLPIPLAAELRKSFGMDFEKVAASATGEQILNFENQAFTKNGMYSEAALPEILSLEMVKGAQIALKDPGSILLSESFARAIFGELDPLNKPIKLNNRFLQKIAGVYKDIPKSSTFTRVDFIAPVGLLYDNGIPDDNWQSSSFQIYVQLHPKNNLNAINNRIKNSLYEHSKDASKPSIFLHPMKRWHLHGQFKDGINTGGRIEFVWLFGIIGVFVLLLACINFMNLSTARSEKRAKEVGVRKAIGSIRGQLIAQFFSESFLIVFLAFILSVILVVLALPSFNDLADKDMIFLWSNPLFWCFGLGFVLLTALVSGSYPALYLSSFQPVKVLKGASRLSMGRFAAVPRKVLLVLQFTVSVTLIIGTVVVYRQILYAKDRPIGYSREGLIIIPLSTYELQNQYTAFRDHLLRTNLVAGIAASSSPTTGVFSSANNLDWRGKDPAIQASFGTVSISPEFGKVIGWKMKEGRNFSAEYASDSSGFIFNEAAIGQMGLANPVGEIVKWHGKNWKVLGVVEDMVMNSPFEPAMPTVFMMDNRERPFNVINIKVNPAVSTREAVSRIGSIFKKYAPTAPFNYKFASQEYDNKFASEQRIGKLAAFFAILAIFISCLGLFGLASFVAEQRTKEIGIRKVLGASIANLWQLLSKDFVLLVVISCLISVPVSWYLMSGWLLKYAYHTELSWWIFAMSGAGALGITLLTVSFQAIKAALMNPVKSLKTE